MAETIKRKVGDYKYIDANHPFMTCKELGIKLGWSTKEVKNYCQLQGHNPKLERVHVRHLNRPSYTRPKGAGGLISTQEAIFRKYGV
jgi:hypothetical protein